MNRLAKGLARRRVLLRLAAACGIALLAGVLRLYLADTMLTDWDEDDYLASAGMFRRAMDQGDWDEIAQVKLVSEHPVLVKLLYAASIDRRELGQIPTQNVRYRNRVALPSHSLHRARWQSVAEGTLTVLVLALVSPLAGLALAVASIHAHFSSVAYLDALPTLFTALAVICYEHGREKRTWFWLSGACLGIAVAGKYPFALVGVVVLLHALVTRRSRVVDLARWGALAVAVFFVLNPYLWPDPVGRLAGQLRYHAEYTQRPVVHHYALAPAQQMLNPRDHLEHLFDPGTDFALPTAVDRTLFVLAVPGLALLLKRGSVYGWWLALGLAFLVLWPSQWVQHKMMIMVPFSMAAAVGLEGLGHRFLSLTQRLRHWTA